MNSHVFFKRRTAPSFFMNLLIFCALAIVLGSCTMVIETPIPSDGTGTDLPTTALNPSTEVAIEIPTFTLPPEPTATTEIVTPENFVTVEYKSEDLEENIKAWQEGRMDYQLMEVTEEGWGKGLGLVVDEDKTKTSVNKNFSA